MRLVILSISLLIVSAMPSLAQESPSNGDACTAGQENYVVRVGGPEENGLIHFLRCRSLQWDRVLQMDTARMLFVGSSGGDAGLVVQNAANNTNSASEITFNHGNDIPGAEIKSVFTQGSGHSARFEFITRHQGTLAERVRIELDGRVGIGTNAPNVELDVNGSIEFTGTIRDMSDRRQKTDIRVLTDALDAVSKIDGVSFKMKDGDGSTELGLIAQDVEAVYPELVFTGPDGTKALNYQGMIGPLVEAVKELYAQNAALRADLEAKDGELARVVHELRNRMDIIEGKRRPPLKPYNR